MPESLFLEIVAPTGANAKAPTAELPRQGKLIVGTNQARASFVVEGQGVADVHCAIGRLKGGGWALKDLGSEFGTRVNGKRVDSARLAEGDEILIGSRKLRVFDPKADSDRPAKAASPSAPKKAKAPAPEKSAPEKSAPESSAAKSSAGKSSAAGGSAPKPAPMKTQPANALPAKKLPAKKPKTVELAGYRFERPLGRGGMGDVYLATQTSLDRKVAVKVLKSDLAKDATFVQRFRDEARAAARLNHPNVVTVFDVGEENGRHFLSMEYMDGESVEAHIANRGPMPWRDALDVIRDAAAGLVYAESQGIVHRDIKPENLMRNGDGVTKIADLGLAVQVEQEAVDGGSGKVFGTPHFIAPEVVRGESADARSDMFSLGATAYRVLSGQTPFDGGNAREIVRALLQDEPAPLGSLVPGLPGGFEKVVHRLLEKSPDDRYASASILLRDIEQLRQTGGREASVAAPDGGGNGPNLKLIGGGIAAACAAGVLFVVLSGGGDTPDPDDGFDRFPTRRADSPGAVGDTTSSGTGGTDVANAPNGTGPQNGGTGPQNGDAGTPSGDAGGPADAGASTGGTSDGSVTPSGAGSAGTTPTADEADFEYRAQLAYLELGDESLSSANRAARLRALSDAFAGTDIANKALDEANTLEAGVIAAEEGAAAMVAERTQTLAALRSAAGLDVEPFHPGTALRAMHLIPTSDALGTDQEFQRGRKAVVDDVLRKALALGKGAMSGADAAEKDGDFARTQSALRDFIGLTDLPSAEEAPLLVGATAPASLSEFKAIAADVRKRLESLSGRESEFEADRIQRERVDVGRALGNRFESSLASFELERAATLIDEAAALVSNDALKTSLRTSSSDLRRGEALLTTLLDAWKSPGWRRVGIADPRPGADDSVDVVGVANGAILVEGNGAPAVLPMATWSTNTSALQNLFRGRLDRDWTSDEMRGITSLLTVAATLEALDQLAPALEASGRRIDSEAISNVNAAFEEAREWADGREDLVAIVNKHSEAARRLGAAIVARETDEWAVSAEMLGRLIEEQRDTWLVMILSDGGKR